MRGDPETRGLMVELIRMHLDWIRFAFRQSGTHLIVQSTA